MSLRCVCVYETEKAKSSGRDARRKEEEEERVKVGGIPFP